MRIDSLASAAPAWGAKLCRRCAAAARCRREREVPGNSPRCSRFRPVQRHPREKPAAAQVPKRGSLPRPPLRAQPNPAPLPPRRLAAADPTDKTRTRWRDTPDSAARTRHARRCPETRWRPPDRWSTPVRCDPKRPRQAKPAGFRRAPPVHPGRCRSARRGRAPGWPERRLAAGPGCKSFHGSLESI